MPDAFSICFGGLFMQVAGIIMECNPFHEGHRYIIDQAKASSDAVVVVMSGDFVQRGAPAILNKEQRTRDVLEAGADLVLELPVCYACSGAEYFARAGVTLLAKLGVITDLWFGVSSEDPALRETIRRTAEILNNEPAGFRSTFQERLRSGSSFPAARAFALQQYDGINMPEDGNDLLGVEYTRTLLKLKEAEGTEIRIHTVPRIDTPSASEIREMLLHTGTRADKVPEASSETTAVYLDKDDFSQALLYQLIRSEDLSVYADVSADLADRIRSLLTSADTPGRSLASFSGLCSLLKTRNLTYTRVSRALLHILLELRRDRFEEYIQAGLIGYARVLGFRKNDPSSSSVSLLGLLKENSEIPVITSPAAALRSPLPAPFQQMLETDIRAGSLYDLVALQKRNSPGITPELRKPMITL